MVEGVKKRPFLVKNLSLPYCNGTNVIITLVIPEILDNFFLDYFDLKELRDYEERDKGFYYQLDNKPIVVL